MRLPVLLGLVCVGCAAPVALTSAIIPLGPLRHAPAAPPWDHVAVGEIHLAQGSELHLQPSLDTALAQALSARLGAEATDERPFTLSVENLWLSGIQEATMRVGVSADFVLSGPSGKKVIRLEHSVDFFSENALTTAYARLLDDLLDTLVASPAALAFLGASSTAVAHDASPSQTHAQLGPALSTQALRPNATATGRILWGGSETSSAGAATLMLGDATGVMGLMTTRQVGIADNGLGGGVRSHIGLGGMRAGGSGTSSSTTFFGSSYLLAVEFGYYGTHYDADGYVASPGLTLVMVPQTQLQWYFASSPTGSGLMNLYLMQFGAATELDVPLGAGFGLTAGLFAGGNVTALLIPSSSASGIPATNNITGPDFMWYPFGDLYVQTADSRYSLGLAFQQVLSAFQSGPSSTASSLYDNPRITFTYESRVGRGVAYSRSDVAAMGLSGHTSDALSAPRSAFYTDDGRPVAAPRIASARPSLPSFQPASQPAPPSPPPAPATAKAAPIERKRLALTSPMKMVVLPLRAVAGVSNDTCYVLTSQLLGELDRVAGLGTVSKADIDAMLDVEHQKDLLGCDTASCAAEIGGALGADLVLRGEIGILGSYYSLSLSVIATKSSSVAGRISKMVPKNDDALAQSIPDIVTEIVERLNR